MSIFSKISSLVRDLPLSPRAGDAYIYLAKKQKASVGEVASALNLNRTTAYKVINELIEAGLVRRESANFGAKITINNPMKLSLFAQEQVVKAGNIFQSIEAILPDMLAVQKLSEKSTATLYFEGVAGVKKMYEDLLITFQNNLRLDRRIDLIGCSNLDLIGQNLPKRWLNDYRHRKSALGIKGRFFISPENDPEAYIENGYRRHGLENYAEFKKLPEHKLKIETEISIYADKLSFISLKEEELGAVIIENKVLADSLRIVFDSLWQLL